MTVVTPTDRPKSVRIRCVIEVFGGVFLCCHVAFWIFLWVKGLLSQVWVRCLPLSLIIYNSLIKVDDLLMDCYGHMDQCQGFVTENEIYFYHLLPWIFLTKTDFETSAPDMQQVHWICCNVVNKFNVLLDTTKPFYVILNCNCPS